MARALVAATGASMTALGSTTAAAQAGDAAWIKEVPGKARCFFDCPQHMNGFGLVHILNYLAAYPAGQAGVVSSFYGVGPASSIALGFNDATWAKYGLGEILGLKDASGKPYTRNVFFSPTKADGHLLAQRTQIPASIAVLGDALVGSSIPSLQKMGTKFLLCANALGLWTLELEARGKGAAAAIDKELRANLVPGVTIVPAMVQAIEQAQAAGMSYNRQ
jgi:intracellular sulfur oxidation DsrE/DsrF family protein